VRTSRAIDGNATLTALESMDDMLAICALRMWSLGANGRLGAFRARIALIVAAGATPPLEDDIAPG